MEQLVHEVSYFVKIIRNLIKASGCSIVVVRRAGGAVVRVRFTASRHNLLPS